MSIAAPNSPNVPTNAPAGPTVPANDNAAPARTGPPKPSDALKEVAAAAPANDTKAEGQPTTDDADPKLAERVARINKERKAAREEREALKAEKAAWEAEKSALQESAGNWQRLQEAKTKGGRMAALKVLFAEGEINQDLYYEYTDYINGLDTQPKQLTAEEIDKKVQEKLDAARKAEADERQKAAETQKQEIYGLYLGAVVDVLKADIGKDAAEQRWPWVAAFDVQQRDIFARLEAHHKETGKFLEPEDILDLFEKDFETKASQNPKYARRIADTGAAPRTTTVTSGWRNDAPVRERNPSSVKESLAEAKRLAGIGGR